MRNALNSRGLNTKHIICLNLILIKTKYKNMDLKYFILKVVEMYLKYKKKYLNT